MAESTSPTTEEESFITDHNNNNNTTLKKTESQPIKSALRTRQINNKNTSKNDSKPSTQRTVTFVPGLISGKSDISQIISDTKQTPNNNNDNNNNKTNDFLFDDDDKNKILNKNNHDLNFTNWRFGNRFSGSETSDDEKNFDAMNKKYQTWSHQYTINQQRKEKMDKKLKTSIRKLRKTKANIKKLQVEIDDDQNENNKYKKWKKKENERGVIYISSVPFGCTSQQLRKIFNEFGAVTNVYLQAAKGENGKVKKINNKWTEFCEGWIEFKHKKIAKQVVEILHETKIPKKYVKNRLARSHIWNMKYLKGFGWHHLDEYKRTVRTLQRKKYEIKIADAHRQSAYFESQVAKAKDMMMDVKNGDGNWNRNYNFKEENDGEEDEDVFESSDDDGPPLKKRKLVQQRSVRMRRNHRNKAVLDKLMK